MKERTHKSIYCYKVKLKIDRGENKYPLAVSLAENFGKDNVLEKRQKKGNSYSLTRGLTDMTHLH
jgi:hypothetical protein